MGGIRVWKRRTCFTGLWRADRDMRAKEGHLFGTYIEVTLSPQKTYTVSTIILINFFSIISSTSSYYYKWGNIYD